MLCDDAHDIFQKCSDEGFERILCPTRTLCGKTKITIKSTLGSKPGQYGEQGIVSSNRSLEL